MKITNYLNLNKELISLRFREDRTNNFIEVYHAHQGLELLFVHQGIGQAIIDDRLYEVKPGTLLMFRPYRLHKLQFVLGPESPYIRSAFFLEPHVLAQYLKTFPEAAELFAAICSGDLLSPILTLNHTPLEALIELHRPMIDTAPPSGLLEAKAVFLLGLLTLLLPHWRQTKETAHVERHQQSTVELMMSWVDTHYMEPFELDQLAKAVHLSSVHASALFRRTTGSTLTEYLTARRIREACLLLHKGQHSVAEVGEAVGISNVSYFCQLFKRNIGLSPHQFKKWDDQRQPRGTVPLGGAAR